MRGKDKKKRCSYSIEHINAALAEINSGITFSAAAEKYDIPRTTLVAKKYKKYGNKKGPPTVLTEEEESILVQWLFHSSQLGFPINKVQLLDSVQLFVRKLNRANPFPDDRPSRHWYEAFMRRHKKVAPRLAENLTLSRACVSEKKLKRWFNEIQKYLQERDLTDIEPSRVFNADETCLLLNPKTGTVLVEKGNKNVYSVVNNNEKESLTVLFNGNAAGDLAPPLVLMPYKRIPGHIVSKFPRGWALGRTDTGWMTSETFFEYIVNTFHEWLIGKNIKRPVILFVDGHVSHLTLPLSKFCSEHQIEIIALCPNSTHVLQPMDVCVFRPLKAAWKKTVNDYRIQNEQLSVTKEDFALVLKSTIGKLNIINILKNGFKECGLYPFDVNALDFSKIIIKESSKAGTLESANLKVKRQEGLGFLEGEIEPNTLKEFKRHKTSNWSGKTEDCSLFKIWYRTFQSLKDSTVQLESNSEMDKVCVASNIDHMQIDTLEFEELNTINCFSSDNTLLSNNTNVSDIQEITNSTVTPLENITLQVTKDNNYVLNDLQERLPSPFKHTLLWPKNITQRKENGKKSKEIIPSVVTSDQWQKYKYDKEQEKLKKEEGKELKKRIRLEKVKIKQEKDTEKKQKKAMKKPKQPAEVTLRKKGVLNKENIEDKCDLNENC